MVQEQSPLNEDSSQNLKTALGALILLIALGCSVVILTIFKDLLHGHFEELPFIAKFMKITSQHNTLKFNIQGNSQVIHLPESFTFITAFSMFIFALGIAVGFIKALFNAGGELLGGDLKKKVQRILMDLKGKEMRGQE